ncbi:multicopper oxidase domain-containing protein [Brevibacterium sp.]|uniref:multicopper oxidase family protein n=1 Tax=Brevibacterium sp. TaxID=1701 RepID=UPI002810E6C8|nr:multicopper oxidase domain-containing protein [Brevibacterium sp.]
MTGDFRCSRRGFLTAGSLLTAGALAGCTSVPSATGVSVHAFDRPLSIPPLAQSRLEGGVRIFELTVRFGETSFSPATADGTMTRTLGYNGDFLGPTLRAERGEKVVVSIRNQLDDTTSVHWHGMHLPARMDGGPHQEIAPGGTWEPEWTIDQPAATLWYHPHPHGRTEEQVYHGLAGLFLLDDDVSLGADLPRDYGIDDIPVIVMDKSFDDDGQLELHDDGGEPGMLGDTVLVNGSICPLFEVSRERLRLRLLNGSTARSYDFGLGESAMTLIATDGGFLDEPLPIDSIRLAPGERAEVIATFTPGQTLRLHSAKVDLGAVAAPFAMGGNDAFDVLEFRAAADLGSSPEPAWASSEHAEKDRLHESEASVERRFELDERTINGRTMDMSRVDDVIQVGATEIWTVRNNLPMPHSFHIHDVQFRLLDIDGTAPAEYLAGPKDTMYLEPKRDYRLLLRFTDYTDPHVPYMYHCHMLLHEDEGMMGQFLVVGPGQVPSTRIDGAEPGGIAGTGQHSGHH